MGIDLGRVIVSFVVSGVLLGTWTRSVIAEVDRAPDHQAGSEVNSYTPVLHDIIATSTFSLLWPLLNKIEEIQAADVGAVGSGLKLAGTPRESTLHEKAGTSISTLREDKDKEPTKRKIAAKSLNLPKYTTAKRKKHKTRTVQKIVTSPGQAPVETKSKNSLKKMTAAGQQISSSVTAAGTKSGPPQVRAPEISANPATIDPKSNNRLQKKIGKRNKKTKVRSTKNMSSKNLKHGTAANSNRGWKVGERSLLMGSQKAAKKSQRRKTKHSKKANRKKKR